MIRYGREQAVWSLVQYIKKFTSRKSLTAKFVKSTFISIIFIIAQGINGMRTMMHATCLGLVLLVQSSQGERPLNNIQRNLQPELPWEVRGGDDDKWSGGGSSGSKSGKSSGGSGDWGGSSGGKSGKSSSGDDWGGGEWGSDWEGGSWSSGKSGKSSGKSGKSSGGDWGHDDDWGSGESWGGSGSKSGKSGGSKSGKSGDKGDWGGSWNKSSSQLKYGSSSNGGGTMVHTALPLVTMAAGGAMLLI